MAQLHMLLTSKIEYAPRLNTVKVCGTFNSISYLSIFPQSAMAIEIQSFWLGCECAHPTQRRMKPGHVYRKLNRPIVEYLYIVNDVDATKSSS